MKANLLRKYWIILRVFWLFVRISFSTAFENVLGIFKKESGNRRLAWWSEGIINLLKIELKVVGSDKIEYKKSRRYVLMSNHLSLVDIPIVFHVMGSRVRLIGKSELFKVPIWGSALRATDFISIDRKSSFKAQKDLQYAKKILEQGTQLWIAPEGTRSRDAKLLPFKRGPFKLAMDVDAIILPIGLRGCNLVLPADKYEFHLNKKVEVHIGDPIDTTKYSSEEMSELIHKTRRSILKLTGEQP
ncbi:MAG: 1-acyl-sn-glycerol-3-phosphate acyltransferase [Bacteroidetes bacterium]|nr:1-acyl-sn-glycerol-3-phosphate acyltransferase [Bacteroidota bacterium]